MSSLKLVSCSVILTKPRDSEGRGGCIHLCVSKAPGTVPGARGTTDLFRIERNLYEIEVELAPPPLWLASLVSPMLKILFQAASCWDRLENGSHRGASSPLLPFKPQI